MTSSKRMVIIVYIVHNSKSVPVEYRELLGFGAEGAWNKQDSDDLEVITDRWDGSWKRVAVHSALEPWEEDENSMEDFRRIYNRKDQPVCL